MPEHHRHSARSMMMKVCKQTRGCEQWALAPSIPCLDLSAIIACHLPSLTVVPALPTSVNSCALRALTQYKRMSVDASPIGQGLLWGGAVPHPECAGYGVVYFAEKAMRGRGESLRGKRCIVTGSGKARGNFWDFYFVCTGLGFDRVSYLSGARNVCACSVNYRTMRRDGGALWETKHVSFALYICLYRRYVS